ncbi:unnamed protein product [Heligmosomoides polygyrus]|uniref:Inward rectifier potassium channel n=1 Tax=Heligmosomoides polygyrus TaxID=6339 RepID=A0A183F5K9_HELPZ|nr:unnamed protein product [Heligmosomoides polygyrus]
MARVSEASGQKINRLNKLVAQNYCRQVGLLLTTTRRQKQYETFSTVRLNLVAEILLRTFVNFRYITTECPLAGLTVCLQAVCGLLIQSFMVGLVFAKMARPKKRAETIIFSEKAVICLRDGQLCFLCRVGDMRNTHLVEAHVRLQFISDRETAEGEVKPIDRFFYYLQENNFEQLLFYFYGFPSHRSQFQN